jgi:uncharacterized repeat protein (TIGR03847 family)
MPQSEIELDPVDFVTIGTVGPKGRRVFHLQGGKSGQIVTLVIEKQQAQALAEAVAEMLSDLDQRHPAESIGESQLLPKAPARSDMSLREPIEPLFRAAQMGLGYDEERNLIVLVAQELALDEDDAPVPAPQSVRLWGTPQQFRALSEHALFVVRQGRPDPRTNGHVIYYWT